MTKRWGPDRSWVAGVDGCRGGWVVALYRARPRALRLRLCARFAEVLTLPERPRIFAVDMPIGLLDRPETGGRVCDRAARRLLGERRASVFSPPTRPGLRAYDYRDACRRNGTAMSLQAFYILPKIRELDRVLVPALARHVHEAHPELAFLRLAGRPLRHSKKTRTGRRERLALLNMAYGKIFAAAMRDSSVPRTQALPDDTLDACVLALTALRILARRAHRLPEGRVERDRHGLPMVIWY